MTTYEERVEAAYTAYWAGYDVRVKDHLRAALDAAGVPSLIEENRRLRGSGRWKLRALRAEAELSLDPPMSPWRVVSA